MNFENLPIFDEVMCRLRWLTFFGPPCTLHLKIGVVFMFMRNRLSVVYQFWRNFIERLASTLNDSTGKTVFNAKWPFKVIQGHLFHCR